MSIFLFGPEDWMLSLGMLYNYLMDRDWLLMVLVLLEEESTIFLMALGSPIDLVIISNVIMSNARVSFLYKPIIF